MTRRRLLHSDFVCAVLLLSLVPLFVAPAALGSPEARSGKAGSEDSSPIALVGGKVFPVSGPPIEGGTVLIRNGKIEAVGKGIPVPPDARRIDASGLWVLPGLIDSRTHLGLWEVDLSDVTRDEDESSDPITPQVRVIDAFYDESENIRVTRQTGVALALVAPGDENLINGQSALVDLSGDDLDRILVKFPVAMHFSLGEPPKARYGKRDQAPTTRMGSAALIRIALTQARDYQGKWQEHDRKVRECGQTKPSRGKGKKEDKCPPDPPAKDLKLEALVPVLKGDLPAIFRAQRMDDITTALRLADEFKLKLILSHAAEAYKVADLLAAHKIPVLVGPITTQPDQIETLGAIYENAELLVKAGVKLAIQTDRTNDARTLPWEAGLAVTYGLPWDEALRAVTLSPAEIFGLADRVGSLEKGKDADVLVTTGDPFQPLSQVKHLFIRGKEVSLRSRQDDLAAKYR
ncbi:MAG TPA: amidohydrolase family protein [Candidatus Polarisedimenticolia bacterium]|nr:amidohydrolase family protein [Candidatus Polarisedimenticolia bacterium]